MRDFDRVEFTIGDVFNICTNMLQDIKESSLKVQTYEFLRRFVDTSVNN